MTAIEFNNISKQYRLGLVSTRTLSNDLNRWWTMNILHKEDPYLKIGSVNDRSQKADSDYVWALKNIDFKVESGTGEESDFGKVSQTIGNQTINYNDDFEIVIANYLSGIATVLNAVNVLDSDYVFSKWVDVNTQNIIQTKEIIVELDNTKSSTSTRFYPKVIYNDEKLVVDLICYYSNNTSELTLKIINGGNVSIDGGEGITSDYSESIINNKTTTLVASADEGYRFIGWYVSDVLISTERSYTTSINSDKIIEARFEEIAISGGGLSGWIIALIVIVSLGIIGLIIFIILKIRKNSFNSYKKYFKY